MMIMMPVWYDGYRTDPRVRVFHDGNNIYEWDCYDIAKEATSAASATCELLPEALLEMQFLGVKPVEELIKINAFKESCKALYNKYHQYQIKMHSVNGRDLGRLSDIVQAYLCQTYFDNRNYPARYQSFFARFQHAFPAKLLLYANHVSNDLSVRDIGAIHTQAKLYAPEMMPDDIIVDKETYHYIQLVASDSVIKPFDFDQVNLELEILGI